MDHTTNRSPAGANGASAVSRPGTVPVTHAPIVLVRGESSPQSGIALRRLVERSTASRVAVLAMEQHGPSLALAQLEASRGEEVPYSCSHSLNPSLVRRLRAAQERAELVIVLVGGEATIQEVQQFLKGAGIASECKGVLDNGVLAPVTPQQPSSAPQAHKHLTHVDLALFDSVTGNEVNAFFTASPEFRAAVKGGFGLIKGQHFTVEQGRIVFDPSPQAEQLKSPFGGSFLRLFGEGLLNPRLCTSVGMPLLPVSLRGTALFPSPAEEFSYDRKIRASVWEADRLFFALETIALGGKDTIGALSVQKALINGETALKLFSQDWFHCLNAYMSYRLDALAFLASSPAARSHASAAVWQITLTTTLEERSRAHRGFLAKIPVLSERLSRASLGALFVEGIRAIAEWPPKLSAGPEVLEALLSRAAEEGVSATAREEALVKLQRWGKILH